MDLLENWLAHQCRTIVGVDPTVTAHRNIKRLVRGSIYQLPLPDSSVDLITCNMVVEHLSDPAPAFREVARCLRAGGAFIVNTPNLANYGILANLLATRVLPQKWRLRLVHGSDGRDPDDIYPVQYKANTMNRLTSLLNIAGLQMHKAISLRQHRAFFRRTENLEALLMRVTPISGLLLCAHKTSSTV